MGICSGLATKKYMCLISNKSCVFNYKYNPNNKSITISLDVSNAQSRAKFSREIDAWLETTTLYHFIKEDDLSNEYLEDDDDEIEDEEY